MFFACAPALARFFSYNTADGIQTLTMSAIRQKITEGKLITVPNDSAKAALQQILPNNIYKKNICKSQSLLMFAG